MTGDLYWTRYARTIFSKRFTQNKIPYLEESSGITEEVYFEQNDSGPNVGHSNPRTYLSEEDRENFNDTEIVMSK
jgi:hypothetical protein